MRRSSQACSKSAMNSLPPSTWMEAIGKGMTSAMAARKRLALPAVAWEKARVAMCRVVGQMARNSLMVWPSRLKVMWSTWTSSPGAWALAPYLHRSAQAPSKLRRRLGP